MEDYVFVIKSSLELSVILMAGYRHTIPLVELFILPGDAQDMTTALRYSVAFFMHSARTWAGRFTLAHFHSCNTHPHDRASRVREDHEEQVGKWMSTRRPHSALSSALCGSGQSIITRHLLVSFHSLMKPLEYDFYR